jgi:alcohol dehydrogenase (cytochrome c)
VFALPSAGIGAEGPKKAPINPSTFTRNDPAQNGGGGVHTSRSVADGVFSAAQAALGKAVYTKNCAACHGADLSGSGGVPPLKGAAFLTNWKGHTVGELYAKVRTMPPGAPGSLSDADYLAAVAYLLQANGSPPGQDLPQDEAMMNAIGFGG